MITNNNIIVQISFYETMEKFIFSTNTDSTNEMAKFLAGKKWTIKEMHLIECNKFKKLSRKQFIKWFDFNTELLENLNLNN